MASQLFNITTTSGELEKVILLAGKDKLRPYIVSPQSRALFAQQPGQDITFARNSIQPRHIESRRQSYINAILIQSRGTAPRRACDRCSRKSAADRKRNIVKRFAECRVAKGHFDGCCANCKWSDKGKRCSYVGREEDNDSPDEAVKGERYEDVDDDSVKTEGKEAELEREDKHEEEKIRYEPVADENNGEDQTAWQEEGNEILRKLLLPHFNGSSNEQMRKPVTPDMKEEHYSSEEEWQGLSP